MSVTINVNGLTLCHKASSGISSATVPDVCKTPAPGGPVPIPYPNIAKSSDLAKGTTTISADGGNMCANYGSEFSVSTGDGPGSVGGVKSGTVTKEASWIVDPASVSLLLNLCEWATLNIAAAVMVEVLVPFSLTGEPEDRPLPQRCARLSFPVEEKEQPGEGLSIQVELVDRLTGPHVSRISGLLKPWHTALFREGFALPTLPAGESEVRPADPPIVVVDDQWSWNFEVFAARYEAVHVFLNCLERIHQTVCRIKIVAVE